MILIEKFIFIIMVRVIKRIFFEWGWCFNDKMDFYKNRLENNYYEKYGNNLVLEHLLKVNFSICNDVFIVKFITDGSIVFEDLFKEKLRYGVSIQYNVFSDG